MNNKEILNTEILRARIVQIEYGESESGKTKLITEEQIRRIYIEETGQEPPGEITL